MSITPQNSFSQYIVKCAIALGSNLGNSEETLKNAVKTIKDSDGIELIKVSNWYQTKPIGPPQPDYINGCIIINTHLSPQKLLQKLMEIEIKFGRERKERWGARTLDLDIIFYGDLILNLPELEIPHPRMRERSFVLIPLAEIERDWVDPITGLTVLELKNLNIT